MGYTTEFKGVLNFTKNLTGPELAYLNTFLSKDRRDIGYKDDTIYQGGKYGTYWYHIDYQLSDDFSGIEWNGTEKAYDMEHIANWLIDKMKEKFPDFELTGEMSAQGEETLDRWSLVIKNGRAVKEKLTTKCKKIKCPECDCIIVVKEAEAA